LLSVGFGPRISRRAPSCQVMVQGFRHACARFFATCGPSTQRILDTRHRLLLGFGPRIFDPARRVAHRYFVQNFDPRAHAFC
jgi:hypothetical protein